MEKTYQKSITEPSAVLVCQPQLLLEKKNDGRFGSCVESTLNTSEGFLWVTMNTWFSRPCKNLI